MSFGTVADERFIHNWYFAILGIASLAAQFLLGNEVPLQVVSYSSGILSLLAAALPTPGEYQGKYERHPPLSLTPTLVVGLLFLLSLVNFLTSGVGRLLMGYPLLASAIGVLPWIAVHGVAGVAITSMVYVTVCRVAGTPISGGSFFPLSMMGALLPGILFTPAGTIGYWIRMARAMDNALMVLLTKSLVVIPPMAILSALLSHCLLLSFPSLSIRLSILRSMELIVGSAALYSILLYFTSFIGSLDNKFKDPIYVVVAFQYALLFVSTFHVSFWLVNLWKA